MTLLKLFLAFLKIGVLGYGGGLAIVRLIYDSIQQFGNISEELFANIVAISQVTPGPLGINVATYIGYETAGPLGSIVATLGVALPAFIIVTLVCKALFKYMDSWGVQGALTGIRPATIGLIASALTTLVKPAVISKSHLGTILPQGIYSVLASSPVDILAILMALTTVLLIAKFNKKPIPVLLIMGLVGALLGA